MAIKKGGPKMKRCYMCHGKIEKRLVDVTIEGVVVKDIPAEVCTRCGEQYFDTETAAFIQNIARYVEKERPRVLVKAEAA